MGTLREKIRFSRKIWLWVEFFMLTIDLKPCCLRANWVMGLYSFYMFWGVRLGCTRILGILKRDDYLPHESRIR